MSAILGGVAGANKTTAGTVTLTGANTYTGLTTVSAGTLNLNTTGANSIAGNLTVSGGAAVLQQSNQIANTASVVVSGGTLDLGANSDTVNAVQLTGGNISGSGGTLTSTNTFDLQAGAVSAILGGAAGANKTTAGTVTFTGANTYTGLTTVSAGTLNLNTTGANSIAGNLTVSGGTAVLQQSNQIANTASVVVAGGTLDIGANSDTVNAVQLTGGNISGSGGTLTSTSAFDLQAGAVSAILGGAVGANKTTAGTVTLSGATTYTGLTTVSAGTLNLNTTGANSIAGNLTVSGGAAVLQQSNQIADTASVIVSGGTLDIGANSNTVAAVQLAAGSITGTAGTLTSSSDFDLRSGSVSAILGGSVGVAKNSAGAVTLSRDNTYAGATSINAGTLTVSAGNALGTTGAGTTVSSGATLAINNTALAAEPVTLNGDGVSGAGALTGTGTASLAGNVTLTTASTIGVTAGADALTLSGTVEGPGALSLIGAGTVTLGGTAGNATALASLTQNAATTLKLNGGLMRTAGDQTYNGPVTANGATTLRTTANGAHGNIAVNGVMTATAGTLTLDTGTGNAMLDNVLNDFGTVQVTSGGTVSLVDANALTVGASSVGRITALTRSLDLTLGGNITAAGGGNSIVLVAKRNFLNPGAKTLDPGAGGRWLVYSTNPAADTRGGLLYDFKQYNATFGVTPVAQPAGNGFLYTVAPSVTPSLTGTVTKVYDGTADATLNAVNYSFSGTLDGDTITLGNATSGAYDDRHVGAGKPVTVSGLTVGGASNGLATVYGYQLASAAASANIGVITPATLTVTANNQAKTYGTTLTFTGGEFTPAGLQNGETIGSVTLAGAGAASTAHVAVVPYSITASAATGGTFTPSDYTISYVNGALTVNPATLTVTANDQVKAYGTQFNFAGSEFASSGLKNGEMIGSVTLASAGAPATAAATTPVAAPPYPIVASAAAGGTFTAGDYAISYVPGAFTVNAAGVALTVTANNLSKTYGTTLIFTGSEFSATGLQNGEMIGSVTMTSTGAAGAAPVAGNPYAITPIAATGGTFTSSNYTISYVNGALTVVPAPLTIQADNKSRLPNSANPVFTATYTGFQLGETPATPGALTGVLVFKTTAAVSSPSGTYPIVASGQTSNNYAITYVDGTLTIQPSSYEGLLTDLLAAMRRLGIEDYGADIAECLGAGSGAGSAASMAAAPRGVAAKPQRKCSGSASGPSAPAKVIQPPRR